MASNPQPQPHVYPSLPLDYTITCDQQWDIFFLSSLSNILYNPFHSYNDPKWKSFQLQSCRFGRNLQLSYILFSIWGHLKILKIQNLNHVFGCQNNLNWKTFRLQSCRSGSDMQLLYRPFFNWRQFKLFKNHVFKYYKNSQRWRALMLHVTYIITKVTRFDDARHLWLVKARHLC